MIELQMLQVAYVVLQEIKSISVHILCYSTVKHYGICYIFYNYKKREKKNLYPHHLLYSYTPKPSSLYLYTLYTLYATRIFFYIEYNNLPFYCHLFIQIQGLFELPNPTELHQILER